MQQSLLFFTGQPDRRIQDNPQSDVTPHQYTQRYDVQKVDKGRSCNIVSLYVKWMIVIVL